MKVNAKLVIFVLVVLAVGTVFIIPYLNNEAGNERQLGQRQFATTPDPGKKLNEAKAAGRPVFLEFYAVT